MREALTLPITRLSHGVRAIEDPALVAEIAERGIVLEACPTSNVATGVYSSYDEHPLRALHDAGVKVTLGSDDPPYFGASIGGEYTVARERLGLRRRRAGDVHAYGDRVVVRGGCDQARVARPNLAPARTHPAFRLQRPRPPSKRKGAPAMRRPLHLLALLLLIASCAVLVACGDDGDDSAGTGTTPAKKLKVGLVTDIGGLNDRSFNQLANEGLERAKAELNTEGRVLTSKANSDYVPNLSSLAQQKYDLIIGVGFLMAEAMDTVAKKFPQQKFAIIDVDVTSLKSKPQNVQGLIFKEQEAGYLAGYMAGLYIKDEGGGTISSVGGQKIPPVDHYIAGYNAGAKAANPDVKTVYGYSQDFVDQAKCKELALNQIQQGAKVVFQVAGQCGLGAIDAAKEKSVQAIGVDADQAYLGSQVLTSALKRVDVAVTDAIEGVQTNAFTGGKNTVFDVKSDGVGIGKTNTTGSKYMAAIKEIQDNIAAGEIADIPDTVK